MGDIVGRLNDFGERCVASSVVFGKRRAPPAAPDRDQKEPAVPTPQLGGKVHPSSSSTDRSTGHVHYFIQESRPAPLGVLESEIGESVEAGAREITIVMASPGGLLLPMLEFYRRLMALPVKIRTHAAGPVASAGTVLMLAGSDRSAHPDATFLFHPVSSRTQHRVTGFQARSIERHRELYEITLHEIYKARTRLSLETIARFSEETLVFDAQTAIKHGIIDRIDTPRLR
jgi:ATP-dependent protease ClpP protease subunit